jgi:hypothetical protein
MDATPNLQSSVLAVMSYLPFLRGISLNFSEVSMSENAKNQLLELLQNLGCDVNCADFQPSPPSPSYLHGFTVTVTFPDGHSVQGSGSGNQKSDAEIAAAQDAIDQLHHSRPDLFINWAQKNVEAQAGDALIKLGVYLSKEFMTAEDKSKRLQTLESDKHLAKIFDQWKNINDPGLAIWGPHLSEKRKATLVEALLWQRFETQVISVTAPKQLRSLLESLVLPPD